MANMRRFVAVIIAVLVIVAVMTSLFVVAHEADHDCVGEDCHVCAVIAACQTILKTLRDALVVAATALVCIAIAAPLVYLFRIRSSHTTPISLKDKLLN
ncbi:MAG: hypothetical protein IKP68_00320 [Clostridia bacterium]|nr:hypothetical protein [Clostridia bacterium]